MSYLSVLLGSGRECPSYYVSAFCDILFRYFRHYLNLVMLYSVYKDFDLIPYVSLFLACAVAWLTAAL
jgi:hypothetical protein